VEGLEISKLSTEQIEEVCAIAEETAREYVLSKISRKKIETLNISAEAEGAMPMTLTIDVDVALSPSIKDFDVQTLADEAVKEAFLSAETYLRKLPCHSKR
jgi:hypothetical protein